MGERTKGSAAVNERRVRSAGRQVYGRPAPLVTPRRTQIRPPRFSLLQRRLVILAVLVVVLAIGISHLFATSRVEVTGPPGAAELQPVVQKIIDGSWRMGNLLTFDSGGLESKLQQQNAAVRSVSVLRKLPHTVVVEVALKQPSLGWSTGDQKYLLDRDGTVIGPFGNSTLPVVVDGSNLPVQSGQQVVSAHFVAFVGDLMPALAVDKVTVTGLNIKDTTLDLTVATNKGYNLIFDTSRAADDEVADLKAVQTLLKQQNKTPASYIDLRIAGKAYWK